MALPLAVSIRTLLYDKGRSKSLLGQLDLKSRLRFVDTATEINPRNLMGNSGFVISVARP